MAKPKEASRAIGQFMRFRNKRGMFASRAAEIGSSSCNAGTRFPDEPTISKRRGNKKRKKNAKTTHIDEEDIASGDDTDIDSDGSRSPEYVESGDSSSASEKLPDDEDDNVAAKNRTSNDAQAKNTKGKGKLKPCVSYDPRLLCGEVDRTLAPRLAKLTGLDLSPSQIGRLVLVDPDRFRRPTIISKLQYYVPLFRSFETLL
uniref:Uncharacterized protein n=1 Tax=Oryza punctata TaxID=4537 RepID=A0A0E0LD75_ORYPU